ncbi:MULTISPECIES: thioredoxin fold domain-containing protein [Gammaproteobacteria]|uniref:thioredoxin fold domain-containing protein n=1 Tax=Gammaproteobacteria TaxID=1236 RepID=UPI000DD084E0|nr:MULTISPECIES: thioredoxin fold domain-containing protein [Gammaproteobacteria]RTE87012.1 hypothetical protein DQX04_01070 [Aliidiomarina sp. B3213]TCZ93198.1 hypothetical protein EYQ95_04230 [Lysobacter sp. N42]
MKYWLSALITAFYVFNTPVMSAEEIPEELQSRFENSFATLGFQVQRIEPAPELEGFWLAFTSQGIFYISESGEQLLAGKVFDITSQPLDLTEQSVSSVRRELLEEVDGLTLNYPAPSERYEITVFTDHTCPYCRQFHEQMSDYNNLGISVRYLAFPRTGLNTQSATDLTSVWCSDNAEQAMTDAMNGVVPSPKTCDVSMAEHVRLARLMGVTGTPAIVLPSGQLMPGFVPPQRLLQSLRASN